MALRYCRAWSSICKCLTIWSWMNHIDCIYWIRSNVCQINQLSHWPLISTLVNFDLFLLINHLIIFFNRNTSRFSFMFFYLLQKINYIFSPRYKKHLFEWVTVIPKKHLSTPRSFISSSADNIFLRNYLSLKWYPVITTSST